MIEDPKYHIGDEVMYTSFEDIFVTKIMKIQYLDAYKEWFYNNGAENFRESEIIKKLKNNEHTRGQEGDNIIMDKIEWEYHVELTKIHTGDFDETLNELGRDGWELVCMSRKDEMYNTFKMVFKRRKTIN
jgi:hypothetical protein